MPNPVLTPALKEAITIARTDVVILHTVEFRHPSFLEDGVLVAYRAVMNHVGITARLEDDAPMNPGEQVFFLGIGVLFKLPKITADQEVEMTLTVDNIGRELIEKIEQAVDWDGDDPVLCTYRPYRSDDLDTVQWQPPLTVEAADVQVDAFTITARFVFDDTQRFPRNEYALEEYPGLATE